MENMKTNNQNKNNNAPVRAAVNALERHASLQDLVLRLYDEVDYFVDYAIDCQFDGVFTIGDGESEFFFGTDICPSIYEKLVREHPDISAFSRIENGYVVFLTEEKHRCDGNAKLRKPTAEEVVAMCKQHSEAMEKGEEYRADFSGCMISNVDFSDYDISEMCFKGAALLFCDFSESCFHNVDFSNTIFYKCSMSECIVSFCDFTGASFRDSGVDDAYFILCDFQSAKFVRSFACGAEFDVCNLTEVINDESFTDDVNTRTSVTNEIAWQAILAGRKNV